MEDIPRSDGDRQADPRMKAVRRVTGFALLAGVGLLAMIGVFARIALEAQGVPVVSWHRGIALFVPLALFLLDPADGADADGPAGLLPRL